MSDLTGATPYDQVGSLRAVMDASGSVVKTVEYDSFGNVIADSDETLAVPFGFAGGLFDTDTGLTRFGFRDYDADVGRWTAKDPILFEGGDTDLYGYVVGDPVNRVDKAGLQLNSWNKFPTEKEHQDRNKKNRCPSTEPTPKGKEADPEKGDDYTDGEGSSWSKDDHWYYPSSTYRNVNGYECKYGADKQLLPDAKGNYTYNYGADSLISQHIWQDVIPHFYYGNTYTPNLTTVY